VVLGTLAAGLLITVAVVWPAEYGLDPLGTGRLFGLVQLGEMVETPLTEEPSGWSADEITFVLEPFQSVEYKYELERGATLVFEWRADGEVVCDVHAEPAIGPPGYAESFDQQRASAGAGAYTAGFNGIHGWFWENRGTVAVEVVLRTAGFYERAFEFKDGDRRPYGPFPQR
jgi:hypothetical protein